MSIYKQIKVNFSVEDHSKISQIAISENKTIAELIRSRFHVEIQSAPMPKQVAIYKQADPQLLYSLNKIGTNINQIARKLHQGQLLEKRILIKIYEEISKL